MRRAGPDAARQSAIQLLVDGTVIVCVVVAHVVPVYEIQVCVFARGDCQVPRGAC